MSMGPVLWPKALDGLREAGRASVAQYGLCFELDRLVDLPALRGIVSDATGSQIEARFTVPLPRGSDRQTLTDFGAHMNIAVDAVIGARMDAMLEAHYAAKAAR